MKDKDRGLRRLQQLLQTKEVQDYIHAIRNKDEFQRIGAVSFFLIKYNILSKYGYLVSNYIENNVFDANLVTEPIKVIQNKNGSVSLSLSHDVSRSEVDQFLNSHWRSDIKPLLPGFSETVRQETPSTKRDEAIAEDYISKKKTYLTNQGIAIKHSVSLAYVGRVIKRYKDSQKSP